MPSMPMKSTATAITCAKNGKDIIFTCQNNLRYNEVKQECDWAVNVECRGKQDYMWEGIKDNFCKARVIYTPFYLLYESTPLSIFLN